MEDYDHDEIIVASASSPRNSPHLQDSPENMQLRTASERSPPKYKSLPSSLKSPPKTKSAPKNKSPPSGPSSSNSPPNSNSPPSGEKKAEPAAAAGRKRKLGLQHDDWVRPAGVTDGLRDDLRDMGFTEDKVQKLMKQPERIWDPWKGESTKEFRIQQAQIMKEKNGPEAKRRKLMEKNYQPLYLKEGSGMSPRDANPHSMHVLTDCSDWALFDTQFHSYPLQRGYDPPAIFKRYERFETGNKRIIEINLKNHSIRTRATPDSLIQRSIEYLETGPRIIGEEPIVKKAAPPPPAPPVKRKPGRPRKTAPPAFNSVAAPTQTAAKPAAVPAKKTSPNTRASARQVETAEKAAASRVEQAEDSRLKKPSVKKEPKDDSESDLSSLTDDDSGEKA
jgi:hypothetical protein